MKVTIVAAVFALAAWPSVAQTPAGEIEIASQQFVQALNDGDSARLARMYTEDAVLLPPRVEMIEGREAVQKYWRGVFAAGLRNISMSNVRIERYGEDAAREIGWFRAVAPDQRDSVEGKFLTVWRKSDGQWRHDSDIWNFTEVVDPDLSGN